MTTLPEILSTLFHPDEIVSLCSLPPGGRLAPWRAPRDAVAAAAAQGLPDSSNFWFGPNPVRGDIPAERRENEREVTRLGTLSADLDVKPGVFETLDDAYKATARISQMIGSDPVFVIRSGHGLAPIWQIDPDDSDARINSLDDTRRMVSIARRFSRLVAAVTDDFGAKADNTRDLCRIRRAPGTWNLKAEPVLATAHEGGGRPLAVHEVLDALEKYGIEEIDEDTFTGEQILSAPEGWKFAAQSTGYVKAMIASFSQETPTERNPWAFKNAIRLQAAYRLGRISEADFVQAHRILQQRLLWLLENTGTRRRPAYGDSVPGMMRRAQMKIASRSEESVMGEVGGEARERKPDFVELIAQQQAQGQPPSAGSPPQASEPAAAPQWRMFSWDDIGNAERVEAAFGSTLRWLEDAEVWSSFDGRRWVDKKKDEGGARVMGRIIDALPELEAPLYSEAPDPNDTSKDPKSPRESFLAFVKQQRFTAKVKSGAEMVRIRGNLSASSTDFDRYADLLNVGNGVLDLRDGSLRPHAPEHLQRRLTTVEYHPEAQAPSWEAFLERVHPDPDVRAYLQRVVGYSLTGHTREQKFFLHHGSTSNGKSVFLRIVEAVLGEFSQVIPGETLLQKKESQHPTDINRMESRRFLQLSETRKGARFDDALVKRLTGEETVTARGMGKDFREFRISGKVHVVTNHPPHGGDDPAVARRLRVIRWGVTIPKAERDQTLADRIIEHELAGVLAWAVRGAQEWYLHGLSEPVQVTMETDAYVHEEDSFAQWMEERSVRAENGAFATTEVLYASYDAWCKSAGIAPMSKPWFGKEMSGRGFSSHRTAHARGFKVTPPSFSAPSVPPPTL